MSKFVITTQANGDYHFNLVANNGQVILTSQGYSAHASCLNGIDSVRRNAADASKFVSKTASDGRPYFVLMATNGQVIGNSQMYSDESACQKGIASVQANAAAADIDDQTKG